jgi:uncharacterized protein
MIALDTNLLVYAHHQASPFHQAARATLTEVLGRVSVGLPWPCLHEFISVVTQRRIWTDPFTTAEACASIAHLIRAPRAVVLSEGADHLERLQALALPAQIQGGQVHDARIAAICLSHGVAELWSCDRDLSRFPSLRVRHPASALLDLANQGIAHAQ